MWQGYLTQILHTNMASLTCDIHGNAKAEKNPQSACERAVGWDGWAQLVGLTGLTMVIRTGMKFDFRGTRNGYTIVKLNN